MHITLAVNILGGLGLLLLGMKLMTDGLKLAGGRVLRKVLGQWTRTPARGILSGIMLTSMVQSSGAVTVAAIGFVNAGLMHLTQAVWVVYGSNIGTTTTAWIVAFLGLKFNIQILALPFVALGAGLWLSGGVTRRTGLGEALAGFGVFFLGIEILQTVFIGLGESVSLGHLAAQGFVGRFVYLGLGFMLTFLMQSSSASMALVLTATAGNMLSIEAAAAAVIGANVGSTTTAVLAVLRATSKAKRLAAMHVAFNLITGAVAFVILPFMLGAIQEGRELLGFGPDPVAVLALFHTCFNVLGVALLLPITDRLVAVVKTWFCSEEEDQSRMVYLDDTVVRTPALALNAMLMEVGRLGEVARRMAHTHFLCASHPCPEFVKDANVLERLQTRIARFAGKLSREGLTQEAADTIPRILRVSQYYRSTAEAAVEADELAERQEPLSDYELTRLMAAVKQVGVECLLLADPSHEHFSHRRLETAHDRFETAYQKVKQGLLDRGGEGRLPVEQMLGYLDQYSRLRRMVNQIIKGARLLERLNRQYAVPTYPAHGAAGADSR